MDPKAFYYQHHDQIEDKRFNSPYPLRRYVHRLNYAAIIELSRIAISGGGRVLDAGCGEGVLGFLLAEAYPDAQIVIYGSDLSYPNVQSALGKKKRLEERNASDKPLDLFFHVADAERLPYPDNSFDLVISSHVLEHLPDFQRGLAEIRRLTRRYAIVALPTCLNLCAAVLLGRGQYWTTRKKDLIALFYGSARILRHLSEDGVNEGYAGHSSLPHLWRYPWIMKRDLNNAGFKILKFEAGSLAIPFLPSFSEWFIQVQSQIDRFRQSWILQNLGFGSIALLEKAG